jgi:hypothetical protein
MTLLKLGNQTDKQVKYHQVNFPDAPNPRETIYRQGEPGPGGACDSYRISIGEGREDAHHTLLHFTGQKVGNKNFGITTENLLAIALDRLVCMQLGSFPCPENESAIAGLNEALAALKHRTQRRFLTGVLGKHEEVPYTSPLAASVNQPIATTDAGTPKEPEGNTPAITNTAGGEEKTPTVTDDDPAKTPATETEGTEGAEVVQPADAADDAKSEDASTSPAEEKQVESAPPAPPAPVPHSHHHTNKKKK